MALAVLPSKSFIKITVSGTADYWTSNQGFLVGDIITVSGSKLTMESLLFLVLSNKVALII